MDCLHHKNSQPASPWLAKILGVACLLPFLGLSSPAQSDGISIGIGGEIDIDFPVNGNFSIDPSFNENDLSIRVGPIEVNAILVQPDGSFFLAGVRGEWEIFGITVPSAPYLQRYTSTGLQKKYQNDSSKISLPIYNASITALATEQDNSLVVVGNSDRGFISRILPDGSLDATLGEAGFLFNDFGFRQVLFHSVVVRPNGKLVIAGCAESLDASTRPVVIQLLADGTLDASFSSDGIATINTNSNACTTTMLVQPDEAVVLAGNMSGSDPQQGFVARLLKAGEADTGFGTNGVRYIAASPAAVSLADIALRPDGRIVAVGSLIDGEDQSILLSGIMEDGAIDESIGGYTGYATFDALNGRTRTTGRSVLLQPDGEIVFVGDQDAGEGTPRELVVGRPYGDAIGNGTYFIDTGESEDIIHLQAAGAVMLPDATLLLASTRVFPDSAEQNILKIRLRDANGDGETEAWDVTPSVMSATLLESGGETLLSSVITIRGLESGVSVPFLVSGAEYTLNAPSDFRSGYAWLKNGDQIQLRHNNGAESSARLAVGGTQSDSSPAALLTDDVVRHATLSERTDNSGGVPSIMLLWLLACLGIWRGKRTR